MERYFKRSREEQGTSSSTKNETPNVETNMSDTEILLNDILDHTTDTPNVDDIPADPGLRKNILDYHPNDRDKIRRYYLQKGPCQPREHNFPQTLISNKLRRFNPSWFDEFKGWLEYSTTKDAAYCLFCYLFRHDIGEQTGGDSFDSKGFRNWKKKERLQVHVGLTNSAHNTAWRKCEALMNQAHDIRFAYSRPSLQAQIDYRTRLTASVDCVRFLLHQGLAFRGHDESEDSENQGNFLELHFLACHNEEVSQVVLENAPRNNKLIAPDIQKEITHAAVVETSNVIMNDLGDEYFAILLDESRDVSVNEQVAIALRYVDKRGCIIERFVGIVHVDETSASTLKRAIEALFAKHGLSLSRLRGQGYDGASNMRGEFNGLKALIMRDNCSAYYVHCFAHQLQLILVAVAKGHIQIASFFNTVSTLVNIVGSSCKRRDVLRDKQFAKISEQLRCGEVLSGKGKNQEISLQRPGDTRWGSHYGSLINLIILFGPVIEVLDMIIHDGSTSEQRGEAYALLDSVQCFEFAFILHLMKSILEITNELSQVLQRNDQDIINAIALVKVSKQRLRNMRDDGWTALYEEVTLFCVKHDLVVPNMTDVFVMRGRSQRHSHAITNIHHYQVELFYTVVDMQLQELNNRFDEINTELLMCVACLNPCDSFSAFNKQRLISLAKFYPSDFSQMDVMMLANQLESFILDMKSTTAFLKLKGIGELAQKLVETKKNDVYPLVFLLIKLALTLPIATATVERAFSAMKIVKSRLRNRMGDSWMNDCLITYIEKDIFNTIDNEMIVQRFQSMKTRREKL